MRYWSGDQTKRIKRSGSKGCVCVCERERERERKEIKKKGLKRKRIKRVVKDTRSEMPCPI